MSNKPFFKQLPMLIHRVLEGEQPNDILLFRRLVRNRIAQICIFVMTVASIVAYHFGLEHHRLSTAKSQVIIVGLMTLWFACAYQPVAPGYSLWDVVGRWSKIATGWVLVFVLPFALSGKEPTIFFMALIAIIVAIQHLTSIEQFGDQTKQHLAAILNRVGIQDWRQSVFDQYRNAGYRVTAVIRIWTIDADWWRFSAKDAWSKYLALGKGTLHSSLAANGVTKFRFIADNLPVQYPPPESSDANLRADFFRNLLGLTWQLVVFREATRVRNPHWAFENDPAVDRLYIHCVVAHGAPWVHVIRGRTERSAWASHSYTRNDAGRDMVFHFVQSSRPYAHNVSDEITDPDDRRVLVDTYERILHDFAVRGGSAEAYVCSQIMLASLASDRTKLIQEGLEKLLNQLGMEEWYADIEYTNGKFNERVPSGPETKLLAIEVFSKFIDQHSVSGASMRKGEEIDALDLMRSVL